MRRITALLGGALCAIGMTIGSAVPAIAGTDDDIVADGWSASVTVNDFTWSGYRCKEWPIMVHMEGTVVNGWGIKAVAGPAQDWVRDHHVVAVGQGEGIGDFTLDQGFLMCPWNVAPHAGTYHVAGNLWVFRTDTPDTYDVYPVQLFAEVPMPPMGVAVATASYRSKLYVNVNPNQGSGYYTFKVQKKRADGTWYRVGTYRTYGTGETRTLDLSRGTYRVVVYSKYGYAQTTSKAVFLSR